MIHAITSGVSYIDSLTFPMLDHDAFALSAFLLSMLALTGVVLLAEWVSKRLK